MVIGGYGAGGDGDRWAMELVVMVIGGYGAGGDGDRWLWSWWR